MSNGSNSVNGNVSNMGNSVQAGGVPISANMPDCTGVLADTILPNSTYGTSLPDITILPALTDLQAFTSIPFIPHVLSVTPSVVTPDTGISGDTGSDCKIGTGSKSGGSGVSGNLGNGSDSGKGGLCVVGNGEVRRCSIVRNGRLLSAMEVVGSSVFAESVREVGRRYRVVVQEFRDKGWVDGWSIDRVSEVPNCNHSISDEPYRHAEVLVNTYPGKYRIVDEADFVYVLQLTFNGWFVKEDIRDDKMVDCTPATNPVQSRYTPNLLEALLYSDLKTAHAERLGNEWVLPLSSVLV